ncbi:MAG: UDP-3-O-acyl-N-acetylglucosamine deacetylase [Planctomycetia bacterium]|nr:UDP-3-O-acyl-N-acetylglucosamine deacetylase [Planctomycetia bacterium]
MRVIGYRYQRTLSAPAVVTGVGFVTGARVEIRFQPAAVDAGICFRRVDLAGTPTVPAHLDCVSGTQRRTTLGAPPATITLVEHVLASLAGLRIDNCTVELDAAEPPGLDGSAGEFVSALCRAGVINQPARRAVLAVDSPIVVRAPGSTLALHPIEGRELRVSYRLDYGLNAPIPPQTHTVSVCPASFIHDLACCRTFLTQSEAQTLRAQGVGQHLSASDLLVFGARGPIDNALRFADEPARHKILDLIGDLALCGFDIAGHVVAYRSGHALNVELARTLAAEAAESSSHQIVQPSSRLSALQAA